MLTEGFSFARFHLLDLMLGVTMVTLLLVGTLKILQVVSGLTFLVFAPRLCADLKLLISEPSKFALRCSLLSQVKRVVKLMMMKAFDHVSLRKHIHVSCKVILVC